MNINHRNYGRYTKVLTYLIIRLMAEKTFLRMKHTRCILLQDVKLFFVSFDLIMRIANFFSLSYALSFCSSNYYILRITRWNEYKLVRRLPWPRGLRLGMRLSFAGLCVRIPPRAWIYLFCDCCLLSGRGLMVGLITSPEESYRVWCVSV